jgi:hypothetical protein
MWPVFLIWIGMIAAGVVGHRYDRSHKDTQVKTTVNIK